MKHTDLIEKKRHGSAAFPIEYYYADPEHPRYVMSVHWHREFELIRVLKGKLHIFLEGEEYVLSKGEILMISGGLLHRGEPEECIYECLVFDPVMLRRASGDKADKFLSPVIDLHVRIPDPLLKERALCRCADSLFDLMSRHPAYYELEVYGHLFSLMAGMYRTGMLLPVDHAPHTGKTKNIMKLISWLEQNYAEPLKLESLSERSGLSSKYLCRVFKEYTAKTPIEYITELRVENACIEMTTLGHSVTEAAFNCGFNDLSYFCKVFKRLKGQTPKEYQKSTLKS